MALSSQEWAVQRHRYRASEEGPWLPGVTSIVEVATDKGGMVYAAAQIAAEALVAKPQRRKAWIAEERERLSKTKGNTPWARDKRDLGANGTDDEVLIHWARGKHARDWKIKSARGQRIHDIAEAWSRGASHPYEAGDEGYVRALERYFVETKPIFAAVECVVVNAKIGYGGRFDTIVNHTAIDNVWRLGDYKTGSTYPFELALQAIGYMNGETVTYDDEGRIVSTDTLKGVGGAATIKLMEDGTYRVSDPFEKIDENDAWRAFVSAHMIYTLRKQVEEGEKDGND